MRHTDEQIERAARAAEAFDPSKAAVQKLDDLRAITEAVDEVSAGETRLREAVAVARAHGRSWNQIAVSLGVSRQAARQRFAGKVPA